MNVIWTKTRDKRLNDELPREVGKLLCRKRNRLETPPRRCSISNSMVRDEKCRQGRDFFNILISSVSVISYPLVVFPCRLNGLLINSLTTPIINYKIIYDVSAAPEHNNYYQNNVFIGSILLSPLFPSTCQQFPLPSSSWVTKVNNKGLKK